MIASNLPPSPQSDDTPHSIMLIDATGREVEIVGKLIGSATSYMPTHNHIVPRDRPPAAPVNKCSHCRWFEIQIFVCEDKSYVVWTLGRSSLPGERTHHRVVMTPSAWEVVEILTVRKNTGGQSSAFLPMPSARALSQASAFDVDIREAYVNRAVA
jgi:hypothetical protein